jgi:hypothetical protein
MDPGKLKVALATPSLISSDTLATAANCPVVVLMWPFPIRLEKFRSLSLTPFGSPRRIWAASR